MPAELLRVWVFFALCIGYILAAPTANVTATTYGTKPGLQVTVAPEPRGRGTFRIVFSCTATFVFCIWTAVHPNIIGGTTRGRRLLYKATLMSLAVLVPEGLIMFAFGQWREAKAILNVWTKAGQDKTDLGMEGAFFVLMGGFYVESFDTDGKNFNDPIPKKLKPSKPKPTCTVTLTAKGFKKYVRKGYLHSGNINKRLILDKGKSNNIAKVLAGSQALWLCVQCIARWVAGLPLTLLEIHVAIQVLTALAIYLLWWHKPLDVNEPIEIKLVEKGEDKNSAEPDLPLAGGQADEAKDAQRKYTNDHWKKPHDFITKTPPSNIVAVFCQTNYEILAPIVSVKDTSIGEGGTEADTEEEAETGTRGGKSGMFIEGLLVTLSGALHAGAWNLHFPSPVEALLWRMSAIGMLVFPLGVVFMAYSGRYHEDLVYVAWRQHLCNKGVRKYVWECLESIHCICVSHATGKEVDSVWDEYVSKQSTAGTGQSTAGNAGGQANEEGTTGSNEMDVCQKAKYFANHLMIFITLLLLLGYAISIVYIIVESYISIRSPPDGAFLTPTWSNYWPHL